ncbi:MAG: 8-amino-7-oxononanoate synthase [Rhodospirillales bacterium]|nr:8-amino-7-oxononanoate synthase [Alphaproteobacteria bacterium]MCB9981229.1 8-amino-7-oxononanoate synthase [Rhodospirillales bacterium]
MKDFKQKLNGLKETGRYRSLVLPYGIDLTSNDYLGLAGSAYLHDCAIEYLQNGGLIGAGGSRLLRGHTDVHAALEDFAAVYFAAPKALYFATGFQANSALFQTLCTRHDVIIFDEYVHASAREGIQNSQAQHIKAVHNDVNAFEEALRKAKAQQKADGQIWIAVESVYSMDGDIAPLKALYGLAQRYDAILVVDEAHATGVLGHDGKGLVYDLCMSLRAQRSNPDSEIDCRIANAPRNDECPENLISLHTCGKAMGVAGGLVCAPEDVIDYMINAARGFIYSTAPLPVQAHLVQKSLEIIGSDEGYARREKLQKLCIKAQQLFGGAGTHIVPIIIGDDEKAVCVAHELQQKGYDIRAIRPPTVSEGTARLRLSLSADLDESVLDRFAADLSTVCCYDRHSDRAVASGGILR